MRVRAEAETHLSVWRAQLESPAQKAAREAQKELKAAMPGIFTPADPVRLGQAIAAARQHNIDAALIQKAEAAFQKAQAKCGAASSVLAAGSAVKEAQEKVGLYQSPTVSLIGI